MGKYKYYFKKPKSEIVKDILGLLVLSGAVAIAATSPYFIQNLLREFKKLNKYSKKKVYIAFYDLKKSGDINFYKKNNQLYFSLTKKGKKRAGWMQVDSLRIKKPRKWDGKWRVLLFDIVELKRFFREALRSKLVGMGFVMLQKSAWIIPYECRDEVETLKSFFGLSNKEVRLLTVQNIGEDKEYKKYFKLTSI